MLSGATLGQRAAAVSVPWPEKNGFLSPSATREAWYAGQAQGVAA